MLEEKGTEIAIEVGPLSQVDPVSIIKHFLS